MGKGEFNETGSGWPQSKFYFLVNFGGNFGSATFQEVSGLGAETQVIEYRSGDSKQFSTFKMPGKIKYSNIVLKKGIFKNNAILSWFNISLETTIETRTVSLQLLDENNQPEMTWTLQNAFPVNIKVADLKANGNEVAIETMELAYKGLTVQKGDSSTTL